MAEERDIEPPRCTSPVGAPDPFNLRAKGDPRDPGSKTSHSPGGEVEKSWLGSSQRPDLSFQGLHCCADLGRDLWA